MNPTLKSLLHSEKILNLFALGQLCHPKLLELVACMGGFDAIWLDQEHVGLTIPQIEEATRAARAVGMPTFVRLTAADYATTMRPLEAGAGGVMAAMIRSVQQARDVVSWARFHPLGMRGVNGSGVDNRYGLGSFADYFRRANDSIAVGIQIEHIDAVAVVEEIAAVPGVDFLFLGPADLSQSLGIPGQWDHPELWKAIDRVAKACAVQRVPWGVLTLGPTHARRCVDLGCRMLSIGLDMWTIQKGVRALKEEYGEFFTME